MKKVQLHIIMHDYIVQDSTIHLNFILLVNLAPAGIAHTFK